MPFRVSSMGNCLSSQGADDLSLLNESEGASLPGEPPPPYQVCVCVRATDIQLLTILSDCRQAQIVWYMYGSKEHCLCDLDLQEQQGKFSVGTWQGFEKSSWS